MVRVGLGDGACLSTIQITEKLQWFVHNADVKVTRPQTDLNIHCLIYKVYIWIWMIYNYIIFTDLEETMVANNDTNNVNNVTVLGDN